MENNNTKNKKKEDKPLTPLEALRMLPKAMQVGPQPQLRKSFSDRNVFKLKGGTEK